MSKTDVPNQHHNPTSGKELGFSSQGALETEVQLSHLVYLAAYVCQMPTALLRFVNHDREENTISWGWRSGSITARLPPCPTPTSSDLVSQVNDLRLHPELSQHPLVVGFPYVRFYASVPLEIQHLYQSVHLCVIDYIPRVLNVREQSALTMLADLISVQLGAGRSFHQMVAQSEHDRQAVETLRQQNALLKNTVAALTEKCERQQVLQELLSALQACTALDHIKPAIAPAMQQLYPQQTWEIFAWQHPEQDVGQPLAGDEKADDAAAKPRTLPLKTCQALQGPAAEIKVQSSCCLYQTSDSAPCSTLCIPLRHSTEMLGLLHIASPKAVNLLPVQVDMAKTIAQHLTGSLHHFKQLEFFRIESIRDPLTGLFNRRYLTETLEPLLWRCRIDHCPVSIVMIDIDFFKRFNDEHGHLAGDSVLRTFGMFLRGLVRSTDIACRYGGEEFMLVLPDTSLQTACQRAEKLRRGIHYLTMQYQGQSLGQITVSAGVATAPRNGTNGMDLIHAADRALYRAKSAGRDRVCIA